MSTDPKKEWEEYRQQELLGIAPILAQEGYILDDEQPHISGERYLQSGKKLVLAGKRLADGLRAIIKVSSHPSGKAELAHEHETRQLLNKLPFAYDTLLSPTELLHAKTGPYTFSITAYLEHERSFLERPLKEQFNLLLRSLEAQEGVHAATYGHAKLIRNAFGMWGAKEYIDSFIEIKKNIEACMPHNRNLEASLEKSLKFLRANADIVERYCGFLTHADFLPHNLRVVGTDTYLLYHTSLRFGNKYESWARVSNFMMLYNPPLEQALLQYVRDNRDKDEYLSLRLMRAYKLSFLISYHAGNLAKTTGDLHALSESRVDFWHQALGAVLNDAPLDQNIIEAYKSTRDRLRSPEEKRRQEIVH
jgi:hypothetical protein